MTLIRLGAILGLLFAIMGAATSTAQTANLTLAAPGKLLHTSTAITPATLAPAECAAFAGTLVEVLVVTGGNQGANASLILGDENANTINGQNGRDCLLGGGGDDTLRGCGANDVILGGPGADFLRGDGGGNDICIGGADVDSFDATCETQTQ